MFMGRMIIKTLACCLNFKSFSKSMHICVVGSGPAGFYITEKLLKRFQQAKVDIVERLPTPFGLVRSGVAPDHPETKVVTNQFSRVVASERCSFFGNVHVGKDVSVADLRRLYNVVVLAYGAESDRALEIPGVSLSGVHSAREFVWWYNAHPDYVNLNVDLQNTDVAVILGQGNVALDVARILLRPVEELATTDIAEHSLNALRSSNIRRVYLVGRRGPVQAACTTKELREILGIIPNFQGRVLAKDDTSVECGLYVVGWLKRGPSGIIGTNLVCAEEVVQSIVEDNEAGLLPMGASHSGNVCLQELLQKRGINFISFKGWLKINAEEIARGSYKGKPREKITSLEEMLKIVREQ